MEFYKEVESLIDEDQLEEIVALETHVIINTIVVDTLSSDILSLYGETYLALGDFEKSADYFKKAQNVCEQLTPLETKGYSNVLYNLTSVYLELGRFKDSRTVADKLLAVDLKLYGKKSVPYFESVIYYKNILVAQGEYKEAIALLNTQANKIPDDKFNQAILNASKGDVLSLLGNYDQSKELLDMASSSFSELSDTLNFSMAQSNLGLNYISQGKYPLAERIFLQTRDNLSSVQGTDKFIDIVNSNLGLTAMALGRSAEAIKIYKQLLAKDSAIYGTVHPNYLTSLINVGTAYDDVKNYDKAAETFDKALSICPQIYGADNEVEATILNNLANVYRDQEKLDLAIQTYDRAKLIFERKVGKKSDLYATVIFNTGKTLLLKKSVKAEGQLLEALKIRKEILGESHPKYAEVTNYLAIYYWQKGDLKKSREYFEETFENFFEQIRLFFPSLSEEEKTKFYLEKLRPAFEQYNSLVAALMTSDPAILGQLYDYQLRTKGIIMAATERLRRDIYGSKDSSLIKDFESWKATKERLSKLYSNNDPRQELVDSLDNYANTIEKRLVNRSSQFADTYGEDVPDWKKVRDALKDDESAVEIIRYRVADPNLGGAFSNDIHYLALVIDKESEHPRAVLLTRGNLMEERYLNNYRNSIRYQVPDKFTYQELWKPLADQFKGSKKVFISPDGVYNQVNMSTLVNPETGEFLIKEIEIQEVTSTRDILTKTKSSKSSSVKYLFGFPTYTTSKKSEVEDKKLVRGLRGVDFSETRGLRGGLLRYMRSGEGIAELPGTKTEVEEIAKILISEGQTPNAYTSDLASESKVKAVSSPGIIHIATHGYFLENPPTPDFGESNRYYQNPLLRAGIILAGAEDFLLTGTNSVDNEDGILTAYEAMNMDLNDTELVVLSACETGLGEVSNGEGVYGLQRAFKIAGARYIVMSMWNVDDDATQRLMTLFYENLAKGKDKYYAFRDAQIALMDEYKEPFYWGAFKIVGD
jgi:CHAT domain-containing protein